MRFTLISLVAIAVTGSTAWARPVTKTASNSPFPLGGRSFEHEVVKEAVPTTAATSPFQFIDREERPTFEISHYEEVAEAHFALI
jgi:hypothetical protein